MFKRIETDRLNGNEDCFFTFGVEKIPFRAGDSVAAALLAAGVGQLRDGAIDGRPRAPYCMMGVCFECLVEIDGKQNQQACLTRARTGMRVERQSGARTFR